MSYWTNCVNCDRELPYPSMEERLAEKQVCPGCRHVNATDVPLGETLVALLARVVKLEEKLR